MCMVSQKMKLPGEINSTGPAWRLNACWQKSGLSGRISPKMELWFRAHSCNITWMPLPYIISSSYIFGFLKFSWDEHLHSVSSLFNGHWVPGWKTTFFIWVLRRKSKTKTEFKKKKVLSLCGVGAFEMMQVNSLFGLSGVQGSDGMTEWDRWLICSCKM